MSASLLDEDLLSAHMDRAAQLPERALRRALLNAIGRRSRAAAATIMEQRGPIWDPYAGFSPMAPSHAIEEYCPEELAACLQAAALRSGKEVVEEVQDLAGRREILPSDQVILSLAKEAITRIGERMTVRSLGQTLLRPAAAEESDRLVRPAPASQASGQNRLLQPVELDNPQI